MGTQEISDGSKPCPVVIYSEENIYNGQWVGLKKYGWRTKLDDSTKQRVWEVVYRTSRPRGTAVDGVTVIPVVKKEDTKYIIIIKQWRIPIGGYSIEFPAGLMDKEGEDLQTCGIRELKEETGYTALKVLKANDGLTPIPMDPGMSSSNINFVILEVDGDSEENKAPQQQCDDSEEIEVMLVPINELLNKLDDFNADGLQVEASLYSFALGLNMFRNLL